LSGSEYLGLLWRKDSKINLRFEVKQITVQCYRQMNLKLISFVLTEWNTNHCGEF